MKTPSPALRSHWPQQAFVTIVTLIGLAWVAGSYGYYRSELEKALQVEHQTLDAIGRLKSAQIEHWRAERLADATRVASNLALRQETELLLRDPARQDRLAEMQQRLQVEKMVSVYSSVLLIDPRQQTVLAGSDIREPFDAATQSLVAAAIAGNDAVISSFFRDSKGIVSIDVAVALRNAGRKPLAVVILRSRAQDYLYPLIQASSELRSSGETLLFERSPTDVVRLSDPRGRSGLALSQHIPLSRTDVAAVRAALGQQGRFQGLDDRGEPVLADLRWIPGSPWFMVAKLDLEEVVEKTRYQVALVSAIVGLSILLAAGAIAWVYRKRQSGILQDLFESERQQWEAREFFRTTLYGIGDAVITADVTGRLRAMNPVAERLTGWTEMQALGKPIAEVFRIVDAATRDEPECRITSVLRNGQVLRLADNMLLIAKDGTERPIAESAAPIRDHRGVISGVVLVFSDQVEPHTARLALGEREERLRLALSAAKQGLFDLNVQTGDATVNSEYATMLGFDPAEFRETHDAWIERLHPDDRTRVEGLYEDYIAGRRDDYQVEFRQRTKSGEWKWVLSLGSVVTLSADGRPLRMVGTHTDITERKHAEAENREWRSRYEAAISATGQILYDWDPRTDSVKWGGAVPRILGLEVGELGTRLEQWVDLIHPEDVHAFDTQRERVIKTLTPFKQQYRVRRLDGSYVPVEDQGHFFVDLAGQIVRMVGFITDIGERKRTEEALVASEAQYRRIVETSLEGIWMIDEHNRTNFVNHRMAAMLGYSVEEMLGRSLFDFMEPDCNALAQAKLQQRREGVEEQHQFKLRHKSGAEVWTEMSTGPVRDQQQTYQGSLAMVTDITERRRLEEQVRATREHFQALVERSHDLTLILDQRGTIRYVNPASREAMGFEPEELIGRRNLEFIHPEDLERSRDDFERQLANPGSVVQVEIRVQDKRGGWRVLEAISTNLLDVPSLAGLVINCRDITERKQAAESIKESERRLATLIANLPGYVYRVVNDGEYSPAFISESVMQITGYTQREYLVDRTISCGAEIHPEDREGVRRIVQAAVAAHEPYECEYRLYSKSGELKWVWERGRGTFTPTGELLFLEGFVTDITERIRVIEALRQSEENLAITLESIGDAVIATDPQGRVTRMNKTAARMTGWSLPDAAGRPLTEIFQIVDALTLEPVMNPVQRVLARQEIVELPNHATLVSRNGAQYQIADSAAPIRDQYGKVVGVVLVFSDVSEQYRVQQALRDREQRLRTIIETEPECVKVVGSDGMLLEMNAAGLAMLEADSVDEARHHTLLSFMLPEYRRAFIALHQRVMRGESGQLTFEIVGLRGTRRWLETRAAPMHDASGEVVMLLGVTRDISERKRAEAEKEKLEAQLRQSQKMDAVGQLAGGVAHDFNNLLTVIIGRAELVLADLPESDPMRSELQEIHSAGERAAALTGKLLAFSRKQVIELEVLELNTLIEGLQLMLRRLIREDIELVVVPAAGLGRVKADRGQLEQVVMNLAINARDAMPSGGRLTIETRNVELDKDFAVGHPTVTPGPHVMLEVSDTGIGIDQATLARIFEPFFTTKEIGHGTGLGLSTVYGIVTRCGGAIDVQSEPGKGSTFRVYLPRTESETPKESPDRVLAVQRSGETLLIVDDEEALVRVATRMLESAGYKVLSATNGAQALELLERHGGRVNLMLTDVEIPGMSGPQLAARVAKIYPGTRLLYTSGYSDDAIVRGGVTEQTTDFISKPYAAEDLRSKVRKVLDAPPRRPSVGE